MAIASAQSFTVARKPAEVIAGSVWGFEGR
jgi:hypothetical protein